MDVFITLLSLGSNGYRQLLSDRKVPFSFFSPYVKQKIIFFVNQERFKQLKSTLDEVAAKHNLNVLDVPGNDISLGSDILFFF